MSLHLPSGSKLLSPKQQSEGGLEYDPLILGVSFPGTSLTLVPSVSCPDPRLLMVLAEGWGHW